MSGGSASSLVERLLVAALFLLVAAIAIRAAVHVVLSVLWPLIGLGLLALAAGVGWRLLRDRRGW